MKGSSAAIEVKETATLTGGDAVSLFFRKVVFGLIGFGLVSLVGCGPSTGTGAGGVSVKGKVVKDKKPLSLNVMVMLYPAEGQGAGQSAQADANGAVTWVQKFKPGKYKASVYHMDMLAMKTASKEGNDPSQMMAKSGGPGSMDPMEGNLLRNDAFKGEFSREKTQIMVTVGNSDTDFGEIDLADKLTWNK